ncbi:MAG TPA: cyclic nucleotide-binding domain-containing protein [Terriglobia bacterium]|jgi:CRP-like cAMP-binding protein|nr:cyclic nucleotide-binding domain-containing protein [Terriglobia bacterium]
MVIRDAYLFQGMSTETQEKVAAAAREESYPQGAFLFRTGDPADYLYILQEGRVRLSMGNRGHIALVVSEPGDAIGWSSMVENEGYTASAECLLPVRVLKIEKRALIQILERDPAGGVIFFRRLAGLIGRRLTNSYKATVSLHGEKDPRSYG